jgi:hypothetical protein
MTVTVRILLVISALGSWTLIGWLGWLVVNDRVTVPNPIAAPVVSTNMPIVRVGTPPATSETEIIICRRVTCFRHGNGADMECGCGR